jgi:hypothetical protein
MIRSPAALDHDARACDVCGCRNPWFGFGPPLTEREVWACAPHRLALGLRLMAEVAQKTAPMPRDPSPLPKKPRRQPDRTQIAEQHGLSF